MDEMVTIPKKEYDQLLKESLKLSMLEGYGVDNWQGYDDAMSEYYDELEKWKKEDESAS